MNAYARRIREIAQRLLSDKAVDMVVGYRAGTVALRARPFVARTPAEAGELTWSGFCVGNLARLAAGLSGRVAVCAQGCVSRNLVGTVLAHLAAFYGEDRYRVSPLIQQAVFAGGSLHD